MGHKVSAVHGVKSDNFYQQGNAINEIWIGDLELIARLPFGDSDLGQAGWPLRNWPKIPWHQFIIPLKRSTDQVNATPGNMSGTTAGNCACTFDEIISKAFEGPTCDITSLCYWQVFIPSASMTITSLGTSMLFATIWSHPLNRLRSETDKVRKMCPLHLGLWVDKMGFESLQSWSAIVKWLWRYCLADLEVFLAGWTFVAVGLLLQWLSLGTSSLAPHLFLVSLLNTFTACILLAEMILTVLWRLRRTLNKHRKRIETLEAALEACPGSCNRDLSDCV